MSEKLFNYKIFLQGQLSAQVTTSPIPFDAQSREADHLGLEAIGK